MTDRMPIRFAFNSHGLGDCVHAATAMRLYVKRGYDVQIQVEPNKRWVWEAAGIPIYDGPEKLPAHQYYYPDMGKWGDLGTPDHLYSKVAHFFEVAELPSLGTKEAVWKEVCDEQVDAGAAISLAAINAAEKFLEGLPHPIILLHSKGTNWQAQKSIPDGVAFELILDLLTSTGGSVVTLDWDGRAPTLGHERVRMIKPTWGHISCEQFGALCERADLLIGIDSGPFHLSGWFDIPTLYVSRQIHPVRCCLPSPLATYFVPATQHEHWQARGPEWRFVEFMGPEPSAREIALQAISILAAPEPVAEPVSAGDDFVVGIPTLNRYDLLEQTLDSIEASTRRPRHVIIIDNGGKCPTQREVMLLRPGRNLGVAASWNMIHRMAGGLPVVILNDDLRVLPDTFEKLLDDGGEMVTAMAGHNEWSCMLQRESVWQKVGDYDEHFYPAYHEDVDYWYRLKLAGVELRRAPTEIEHTGSATKAASDAFTRQQIESGWTQGRTYFTRKWGGPPESERYTVPFGDDLQELYATACRTGSDIWEHLPALYELAKQCSHVTEMGTREGNSTVAFLAAQPRKLICYDIDRKPQVDRLHTLRGKTDFRFEKQDVLVANIEPTDLLFIDTFHTYTQCKAELARHASKARRWLVFHDTHTFGERGEDGGAGLWPAIAEFLSRSPEWRIKSRVDNNHGLTVLERVA